MLQVLNAARQAELRIFYALHHRYRQGDYETWKYVAPIQKAAWSHQTFENGTWGGEIRSEFAPQSGEIVAQEHWCSSGFANTDLDLQLKKHGIQKLIIIGLIAHACVEATVRYAGREASAVPRANTDSSSQSNAGARVEPRQASRRLAKSVEVRSHTAGREGCFAKSTVIRLLNGCLNGADLSNRNETQGEARCTSHKTQTPYKPFICRHFMRIPLKIKWCQRSESNRRPRAYEARI
jgi:nicotinamidase-related amidase